MRRGLALVFFFILLLNPLFQLYVILDWNVNRAQIAKELCINRFKKDSDCNGKCQLGLRLKALDQHSDFRLQEIFKHAQELILPFESLTLLFSVHQDCLSKVNYHQLMMDIPSQFQISIPSPPPEVFA